MISFISDKRKWKCWSIFVIYFGFLQLTAICESGRTCQSKAPVKISEIKHENVRCYLLPRWPWSKGLPASRWFLFDSEMALFTFERSFGACKPHFRRVVVVSLCVSKTCVSPQTLNCILCIQNLYRCSFGLYVPKLYFHLNLKWHCSHWKGILFLYVCPKVVFMDKPKIAFFAFKIHTDEYILCSSGLCVPKLYFHLNLKWHC